MSVFSIDMQVLSDLKRCSISIDMQILMDMKRRSISIDMQARTERGVAKGRSFYRQAGLGLVRRLNVYSGS